MNSERYLLTTAGTMFYTRYSAANIAELMVNHQLPLPVRLHTGRSQSNYWDPRDLDQWLELRNARLAALGF